MAQKVVLKVLTMSDDKTRKKAFQAVAEILGVDEIAADLSEQKLTVVGDMDAVAVAKKLKKLVGKVEILSIGLAVEEKKEEKKEDEKKEDKKEEKDEKKEEKKDEKKEEKK